MDGFAHQLLYPKAPAFNGGRGIIFLDVHEPLLKVNDGTFEADSCEVWIQNSCFVYGPFEGHEGTQRQFHPQHPSLSRVGMNQIQTTISQKRNPGFELGVGG